MKVESNYINFILCFYVMGLKNDWPYVIIYLYQQRGVLMNIETVKKEFNTLIKQGKRLYYSMFLLDEESKKALMKTNINIDELPDFKMEYQSWYTQALFLMKLVAPHRINDFEELYKKKKSKELNIDSYCISDALLGLTYTRGSTVIAKPISILDKMQQQVSILISTKDLVESYFYNLELEIHNDILGSELDSAYELLKKKFFRAAGSVAGVVLEKHLEKMAISHNIQMSKKTPTIADFNDKFKEEKVYDVSTWRRIQFLGDIRNLCCHNKDTEPSEVQVKDLLDGVKYVAKNVN